MSLHYLVNISIHKLTSVLHQVVYSRVCGVVGSLVITLLQIYC